MTADVERIATLEALAREGISRREEIVEKLDSQDQELMAIRTDVHAIRMSLAGYKGFFAGASFAVAALGGLIGAAVTAVWAKLFGGP